MRHTLAITGILTSLLVLQCSDIRPGHSESARLARVGTSYLTLDEARQNVPPFLLQKDSIATLRNYREKWIREQLLLREAQRLRLSEQQSVRKELNNARKEVLKNALKGVIIARFSENTMLTNSEILNYYNEYKEQLILSERYIQFRHVETGDLNAARTAQRELKEGIPWPQVAHKYSLSPELKIKNARKFWPVSAVLNDLPSIKPYISTLDSGATSPIQRENGVYHFIQLTDVREKGDYSDPDWIVSELKEWLLIEKQRKHYNSYVKNLYLNAKENNDLDVFNVLSSDTINLEKNRNQLTE